MKCLVTGANGFLGKHLTPFLKKKGIDVVATARQSSSIDVIATGDLIQFANWPTLLKDVDVIVHAAAKAHDMSQSADLKNQYYEANLKLPLLLAEKAREFGVKRFVFISTIKVNGEATFSKPFDADDTPHPTDDYGMSKAQAEAALLSLNQPGVFEVVVIRPCLVYGAGVKANFKNLISLVKKGLPLPFAAIRNKRSFVSVENLMDLIWTCLDHPKAAGQIFLVSDGHDLSLPELIKTIAKSMNQKILLLPVPLFIFRMAFLILGKKDLTQRLFGNLQVDISKTKQMLEWTPPYTMEQSLDRLNKGAYDGF
jgi:nucleoside-diphosphate-sugar epimerase